MKEIIKQERKKLKDLTFKQKLEYIWDYYKPIMAGIIGIIVIISVVVSIVRGSQIETELNVAFINSYVYDDDVAALYEGFLEYSGLNGAKQRVDFDTTYSLSTENENQATMANQMKISAVIAAQSLDVMIMPKDIYQNYLIMGAYQDLNQAMDSEFMQEHRELWQMDKQEDDTAEKVYALKLKENHKLGKVYEGQEVYVAVVTNTTKEENAVAFLKYLLS